MENRLLGERKYCKGKLRGKKAFKGEFADKHDNSGSYNDFFSIRKL